MDTRGTVKGLYRAGWLDPAYVAALGVAAAWWRRTPASLFAAGASRHPRRLALIDADADIRLRYLELDTRTSAIARGLARGGVGAASRIGLLCANSAVFVEGLLAAVKVGADVVLLNTALAGPQLAEIVSREGVDVIVHDLPVPGEVTGTERLDGGDLASLRRSARLGLPPRPARESKTVLLTSGTTGAPKGARRGTPSPGAGSLDMVARVPFHNGDRWVLSAPLFHAWGYGGLMLAASTAATVVLRHRFSPTVAFDDLAEHRAAVFVAVPVMLRRMLDADGGRDALPALRMVLSSGSALPAGLVTEWMDRYGDNLYNMYGSTEAGPATVATPADLRAFPDTAGRAVSGITVTVVDESGRAVPAGTVGRIRVGTPLQFEGYTDAGGGADVAGKVIDGEVHIGDVGRLDAEGRLFVTGRADDMIVSGGENVYPSVTEEVLAAHPDVVEAAVVGVPDAEFGQRLAAYVVRRPGSRLSAAQVRTYVKARVARFSVPRDVVFVSTLPRTASGKVLKRELPTYGGRDG